MTHHVAPNNDKLTVVIHLEVSWKTEEGREIDALVWILGDIINTRQASNCLYGLHVVLAYTPVLSIHKDDFPITFSSSSTENISQLNAYW